MKFSNRIKKPEHIIAQFFSLAYNFSSLRLQSEFHDSDFSKPVNISKIET